MDAENRFDAIVIGAGFSGLYMLHRLRQLGVRTRVLEMAENVGGTWLYNRYPGARCDIESIEYSYSFSEEIQQEWVWTESMPAQPEIEAYLNFVADRLDLRRDIRFDTKVAAMAFDEDTGEWTVQTEGGESFRAPFVVAASGILSVPLKSDIPGMDTFAGTSLYTSHWPKEGFDLTGKRVGVIGTGSTGVQLIPVVAREALQLCVFQRSPAYTLPWRVHRFEAGELDEMKARYDEIRAAQRAHPIGAARLSAFSVLLEMLGRPPIKSSTREEQLLAIEEHGVMGALNWGDIFFDIEANRMAATLYGEAVARIVKDPETAASLVPVHPFACKRPIIDQGYYETFNRDNVKLVDLRKSPIQAVTPNGIRTDDDSYELDVIVYATGFDAMTGALSRIDIRGRDGMSLGEFWASEGTILGWRSPASRTSSPSRARAVPAPPRTSSPRWNSMWSGSVIASHTCGPAASARSRRWPPRSRSGSTTPPRSLRRRCWSTLPATPGTTVATCRERSGCTWATPAVSPNIAAAVTKSRPADTPASSWRR